MLRIRRHVLVLALLAGLAACTEPDSSAQQRASSIAASCEPFGGEASDVAFTDEQATHAIDMADHATAEELSALPGIGSSIASRIIAARPFRSHEAPLSALDGVPYVGPRVLTALRDGAYAGWCQLDDGRQSCCVDLACEDGVSAPFEISDDEAHAVLDWANRASVDELTAVCRIGASVAAEIVDARPIHSIDALLAVHFIGDSILAHMLGREDHLCSLQGSVFEEWCGTADAACACEPGASGFVLDEDSATGWAEEAAGTFYADNADYVWEEHCESAYDHRLPYDQTDVQDFCDRYVVEHYIAGAIQASLGLVGTSYADEDAALEAVEAFAEAFFFSRVGDWMAGFEQALIAHLGVP